MISSVTIAAIAAAILGAGQAVITPVVVAPIQALPTDQCAAQGDLGIIVQGGKTATTGIIVQGGKAPATGIIVQGGKAPSSGIIVQGGREATPTIDSSVKTTELGAVPQSTATAGKCGKARM